MNSITVRTDKTNSEKETLIIDLQSNEWHALNVNSLPQFGIEELKRVCNAYPDGVFPGAESNSDDTQLIYVNNFHNYVEYIKIIDDEVIRLDGQLYLTSLFFVNRKKGWSSIQPLNKEGEAVGYCMNGNIYHSGDVDRVDSEHMFVYRTLIEKTDEYNRLHEYLKAGHTLVLTGSHQKYLSYLSQILEQNNYRI